MKNHIELAQGLIRKADSDLNAAQICLNSGSSFDAVCFHSQQAVEKYLKAYLSAYDLDFPYTHNISEILSLCSDHDASFRQLENIAGDLTEYAVTIRYDDDFWPLPQDAKKALDASLTVKRQVLARLPNSISQISDC